MSARTARQRARQSASTEIAIGSASRSNGSRRRSLCAEGPRPAPVLLDDLASLPRQGCGRCLATGFNRWARGLPEAPPAGFQPASHDRARLQPHPAVPPLPRPGEGRDERRESGVRASAVRPAFRRIARRRRARPSLLQPACGRCLATGFNRWARGVPEAPPAGFQPASHDRARLQPHPAERTRARPPRCPSRISPNCGAEPQSGRLLDGRSQRDRTILAPRFIAGRTRPHHHQSPGRGGRTGRRKRRARRGEGAKRRAATAGTSAPMAGVKHHRRLHGRWWANAHSPRARP